MAWFKVRDLHHFL
jgi:hypothetical protein